MVWDWKNFWRWIFPLTLEKPTVGGNQKSGSSPPGMYKTLVNSEIFTTNLNWWVSEPSNSIKQPVYPGPWN